MRVADTMAAYEAAARAKDIGACAACFADDAVVFFSNGAAHVGKPAVLAALSANFSAIADDDYRTSDVVWLIETEAAALCVYRFAWSGVIAGKPAGGAGRGAMALRRTGEGWRIAYEHLSPGAAA